MTEKAITTGKELERRVGEAYRQMGAWKVEHDVPIAGHQIDVYVEMAGPDRSRHRIAVEAKDWQSPVGINVVRDWAIVVDDLRRAGLIDEGVIVSLVGFTKPARQAATEHVRRGLPVRLLELADLDARVAEAQAVQQTPSTVPFVSPSATPSVVQPQPETTQAASTALANARGKSQKTGGLDAQILHTLYTYYQQFPGDPQIGLNELIRTSKARRVEVVKCLYGLQEKEWLEYDFTVGAGGGLVWLTPLGVRVAEDASGD